MVARKFRFKTEKTKTKNRLLGGAEDVIKPEHIGGPHIELFSNKEMTIDGCGGVLEYCDTYMRLRISKGTLTICGTNFDITMFDDDVITVRGNISSLEFSL